jgi:hypothetical protein
MTKEQLDQLWNAIEYTRGTIGNGCVFESTEKPDWVLIHKGRARQSRAFLDQAEDLVNQLKADVVLDKEQELLVKIIPQLESLADYLWDNENPPGRMLCRRLDKIIDEFNAILSSDDK